HRDDNPTGSAGRLADSVCDCVRAPRSGRGAGVATRRRAGDGGASTGAGHTHRSRSEALPGGGPGGGGGSGGHRRAARGSTRRSHLQREGSLGGKRNHAGRGLLGSSRGHRTSAAAAYAVVWANLCKQYPRLRTVLFTGASERDDATAAAVGLAEAAVRADRGLAAGPSGAEGACRVFVILLGPAKGRVVDSPVPSVRISDAQSPSHVHTL